jgi:phytoene dehydrogenase-like protein
VSGAIVIGAGHNALVAACYLARAGLAPLVLERRGEVGGGALTTEIHPGFRCPTLSHEVLLHERIASELHLDRHGVEFIAPEAAVCSVAEDGPPLVLYEDVERSVESLAKTSPKDAEAYARFRAAVDQAASVLAAALAAPAPDVDRPGASGLWHLLGVGRRFQAVGRQNGHRLLRWLSMHVADLVHEWFDDERLRAAIAARGLSGTMLGPRSAGSTLVMLLREAHVQLAGGRPRRVRGGPGALTKALATAAREAGADIRTGAPVERIAVERGRVAGVVAGGQRFDAPIVVSGADPRTTFLGLVDPEELTPEFLVRVRNYRASGTMAKVNLALSDLPAFRHGPGDAAALGGRIHIGPEIDYLERAFDHAKYGAWSPEPWLDVTIPSILDRWLAPDGGHVASAYVHYAPRRLARGTWTAARGAIEDAVLDVLERSAPGIRSLVIAAETITPDLIESEYGFAGGHVFHGELALDQLFFMRPVLGYAGYRSPIPGLFLCGAGTHPGGFLTGASGRLAARAVLRSQT